MIAHTLIRSLTNLFIQTFASLFGSTHRRIYSAGKRVRHIHIQPPLEWAMLFGFSHIPITYVYTIEITHTHTHLNTRTNNSVNRW